jgi:RsiW-degrading membrane proteinase PrsW (M82 family)
MRSPSRIATTSSLAFASAAFVISFLWRTASSARGSQTFLMTIADASLSAIVLATLVWIGVFSAARSSEPHQRSDRLVGVLTLMFAVLGGLSSIPIPTHNVETFIPRTPGDSSTVDWVFLARLLGFVLLPSLVAYAITRSTATVLGRKVGT